MAHHEASHSIPEAASGGPDLLDAEGWFDLLFRQSPAVLAFLAGPAHTVERINDAGLELTGARDLLGRPLFEALPELEGQGLAEMLREALAAGRKISADERLLRLGAHADGSPRERWFNLSLLPAGGGVLVHALDVTEQVRARRQAEHMTQAGAVQRALLTSVLDQMPAGIVIAEGPGGGLVQGNQQLEAIFRHPVLLSANVQEYSQWQGFHPDGRPYAPEEWPLARALQQGEHTFSEEITIGRGDGTRGVVTVSARPVRDAEGGIAAAVAVVVDVTEHKAAVAALAQSEERYRLAARATNDAIWDWDLTDGSVSWNQAIADLFGWEDAPRGSTAAWWMEHVHPEDRARVVGSIHEVTEGRGDHWTQEYRFLRRDGGYAVVYDRGFLLRAPDGAPLRMVGAMLDLTRAREAEAALRESREDLRRAQAIAQVGSWRVEVRTGAMRWSEQMYALLGVPAEAPVTLETLYEIVHPDDRTAARRAWQAAVAGSPYDTEFRVLVGGEARIVRARARVERGPDGAPTAGHGVLQDVTEARRTERALQESERRLRRLVDSGMMGVFDWTAEGAITAANDTALELLGYTRADLEAGRLDWQRITPEEHLPQYYRALEEAQQRGICTPYEKECIRKDGRRLPVLIGRALLNHDKGVAFFLDMTERKRTEQALRTSEKRLRLSQEAGKVGVWEWDLVTGKTVWTETVWAIYGLRPDPSADLMTLFYEAVHPEDREATIAHMQGMLASAAVDFQYEFRIRRPGGAVRWVESTGRVLRAQDGAPLSMHGVNIDITERKRMEQTLREFNELLERQVAARTEALEQRNRELQQFAYIASHDLQEPLRKVQTFAGLIRSDFGAALTPSIAAYLERMEAAAARMSTLLKDILAFSRVSTRTTPFEPVTVTEVLRQVLSDLDLMIERAGARVEASGDCALEADAVQLRQLLNHLVMNALKFHRAGAAPQVRITTSAAEPARVRIEVADDGIGFDPAYAERIFEPFQRLHGRSEYPGTGMGLAICRRIAERHGGLIRAESAPGRGSRFILELPVRPEG